MPAKPPPNGTYLAEAADDPAVGNPNPNLTPGGHDAAAQAESETPGALSPAERLGAERAERRHQRMLVREASTATRDSATRDSGRAEPRQRATGSARDRAMSGPQTLRDSPPVTLIATVVAGAVLGAILGALSVPGWVIGLLVAVLTLVLSAVVRRD